MIYGDYFLREFGFPLTTPRIKMFPPHMLGRPQEKKRELIPEHFKMPLRVAGFIISIVAIITLGEQLEMPEAPRV